MGLVPAEISSATVNSLLSVVEDVKDAGGVTDETFTEPTYNLGQTTYNPTSPTPGKYYSAQQLSLAAGAATIDLTALPGLQAVIDATGLKLNFLRIRGEADGSNAALLISEGAANPYEIFGGANPITYPAACTKPFTFEFDEGLADVAAGAKEIDLAGAGTDSFFIEMILG